MGVHRKVLSQNRTTTVKINYLSKLRFGPCHAALSNYTANVRKITVSKSLCGHLKINENRLYIFMK